LPPKAGDWAWAAAANALRAWTEQAKPRVTLKRGVSDGDPATHPKRLATAGYVGRARNGTKTDRCSALLRRRRVAGAGDLCRNVADVVARGGGNVRVTRKRFGVRGADRAMRPSA